jgi:putative two-component system response regulator
MLTNQFVDITQDTVIYTLSRVIKILKIETEQHLIRTKLFMRSLGNALSFQPQYASVMTTKNLNLLAAASMLHDVGKISLPASILTKQSVLTHEEFEIMKRHSALGAEIFHGYIGAYGEAQEDFFLAGRDIALYHHEKWDGSGYPDGLAGNAIPLPARLMALVDVYDALTNKKPYKDALPHDQACEIIVSEKGCHFDPELVDVFIECRDIFVSIHKRFPD